MSAFQAPTKALATSVQRPSVQSSAASCSAMARNARSNCWYASPGPPKLERAASRGDSAPTLAPLLQPMARKTKQSVRFETLRSDCLGTTFNVASRKLRIWPIAYRQRTGAVPTLWGARFFLQRVSPPGRQGRARARRVFRQHHPASLTSLGAVHHRDRIRRIPNRTKSTGRDSRHADGDRWLVSRTAAADECFRACQRVSYAKERAHDAHPKCGQL